MLLRGFHLSFPPLREVIKSFPVTTFTKLSEMGSYTPNFLRVLVFPRLPSCRELGELPHLLCPIAHRPSQHLCEEPPLPKAQGQALPRSFPCSLLLAHVLTVIISVDCYFPSNFSQPGSWPTSQFCSEVSFPQAAPRSSALFKFFRISLDIFLFPSLEAPQDLLSPAVYLLSSNSENQSNELADLHCQAQHFQLSSVNIDQAW